MTESSIARDNERLRVEREWSGAELRVLRRQVGKEEQTELSSVGRALDCRSKGRWFNSGSSDFLLFPLLSFILYGVVILLYEMNVK